ncbi:MAG: hypothetical protein E6R11_05450 [Rhodocyclaceae bacterium]|nr:MAG: hypothetical protein EYC71_14780 [Gammaproteobacteria bacterium]TXG78153.1 MAG: hypothetical protein E6R11_05450 [Rhodocyclaceae bacterium]
MTDILEIWLDPAFDGSAATWNRVLTKRALLSLYWALATVIAFEIMHGRVGVESHAKLALRATSLVVPTVMGVFAWFGVIVIIVSHGAQTWLEGIQLLGWTALVSVSLTAVGIAVTAAFYDYYRQATQRERDAEGLRLRLAQTELTLLRGQLESHFLFNTLNSIAALVRLQRTQDAVDAIARLGELMRGILDVGQRSQVSWVWERSFTEAYVALQLMRFGQRLTLKLNAQLAAEARVPPLLLQTLIENAIRHGSLADGGNCHIEVEASHRDNHVEIVVRNPVSHASGESGGVGLENLTQRLKRLYGNSAQCVAGPVGNSQFCARVRFPYLGCGESRA